MKTGTGETQEEWRAALSALHKVKIQSALRHGDANKRLRTGKYLTFSWDYAGWNNNQIHFELMVALAVLLRRRLVIPSPHRIDHLSKNYHDSMVYNLDVMAQEAGSVSHEDFKRQMGCDQLTWYKGEPIPPGWTKSKLPKAVDLAPYRKNKGYPLCNGTEFFAPMLSSERIASFRMLEDPNVYHADIIMVPQEFTRITRYECFFDFLPPCERFVATAGVFNALEYKQDLIDTAADELHRLGLKVGEYDAFHFRAGDFKTFATGDVKWQHFYQNGSWPALTLAEHIQKEAYEQSRQDAADKCCEGSTERVSKKVKAALVAKSQSYPPLLLLSNLNEKDATEAKMLEEFFAAYPGKVVRPQLGIPCDTFNGCKGTGDGGDEPNPMLPIIADMLMPLGARIFVGTSQSTFSMAIHKMRSKIQVATKQPRVAREIGQAVASSIHFTDSMLPVDMPYSVESLGNNNGGTNAQICWNRYTHWNDITKWSSNAHRKCLANFVRAPADVVYQQ